jgi:hypothetical protein
MFLCTVVVASRWTLWLNDRSTRGFLFENLKQRKVNVSRKEARTIKKNKQMGVLFV